MPEDRPALPARSISSCFLDSLIRPFVPCHPLVPCTVPIANQSASANTAAVTPPPEPLNEEKAAAPQQAAIDELEGIKIPMIINYKRHSIRLRAPPYETDPKDEQRMMRPRPRS